MNAHAPRPDPALLGLPACGDAPKKQATSTGSRPDPQGVHDAEQAGATAAEVTRRSWWSAAEGRRNHGRRVCGLQRHDEAPASGCLG
jgi:hypothetical protein